MAIIRLFNQIPFIGWLIWLFLLVPWTIFFARYITLLYESAGAGDPAADKSIKNSLFFQFRARPVIAG